LFDLVKYEDEKLANCFYFSMRNTLVCENMEVAKVVAYGRERHRVVTTAGDVIESSGVMSGGGRPKQGQMSSKVV
jgi:structural maintenance of chromosome 4